MTTEYKKPLGATVTTLLLSILGFVLIPIYPIWLSLNYGIDIFKAFSFMLDSNGLFGYSFLVFFVTFIIFGAVFFCHGKVLGKILFGFGTILPLVHVVLTFPHLFNGFHADLWGDNFAYIISDLTNILYHIAPVAVFVLVLLALLIYRKNPLVFTLPIYVIAAILTILFAVRCFFEITAYSDVDITGVSSIQSIFAGLGYFVLVIPFWIIAILLPPYARRKKVAAAPVPMPAPSPIVVSAPAMAPVSEPAVQAVAPVTPAKSEKKSVSAAVAEVKALFDAGLMTESEFNAKRDEIIGRM